jgi:hypothetical protein
MRKKIDLCLLASISIILFNLVGAQIEVEGTHRPNKDVWSIINSDQYRPIFLNLPQHLPGSSSPIAQQSTQRRMHLGEFIQRRIDASTGEGIWTEEAKGRRWRAVIQSPGAAGIGLYFREFRPHPRGELYVHGKSVSI